MSALRKFAEAQSNKNLLDGAIQCQVFQCHGPSDSESTKTPRTQPLPLEAQTIPKKSDHTIPREEVAKRAVEAAKPPRKEVKEIKVEKEVRVRQRPADLAHLQSMLEAELDLTVSRESVPKKEPKTNRLESATRSPIHSASKMLSKESVQSSHDFHVNGDPLHLFFRARSDERLYSLGESFYSDYKKGQMCFGFANLGARDSQKRSILGVASFIKYFEENSILVLTDKIEGTFYDFLLTEGEERAYSIPGTHQTYTAYECHGVCFVEVGIFASEVRGSKNKVKSSHMRSFLSSFDLILCDLPGEDERKNHYDVYLPVLQSLNHVTLTISLRKSKFSEVDALKKYFAHYKIPLKGSVIENSEIKEKGIRV